MKFNNSTMTRRRFLTTTAKVGAVVAAPVFVSRGGAWQGWRRGRQ